jgi:hypothetical protein
MDYTSFYYGKKSKLGLHLSGKFLVARLLSSERGEVCQCYKMLIKPKIIFTSHETIRVLGSFLLHFFIK